MKKGLLLSVIASSFVFAGGVVVPPPEEPEPAMWTFGGQLVGYYQTNDTFGGTDLFTADDLETDVDDGNVWAAVGIQLRANGNLGYGFGVGFELNGITTLGLENEGYDAMQLAANGVQTDGTVSGTGAWISQAYLTYVMDNTTVKVGRQELPKALSPFAFSETWNVFKNTFEAAVIINSDLPDTTLVGAYVTRGNANNVGTNNLGTLLDIDPTTVSPTLFQSPMGEFNKINGDDGVFMLTAQNKSIEGLTLTGSFYYAANFADNAGITVSSGNEAMIIWGDAEYKMGDYYAAVQGGTVMSDDFADDGTAFGAKVGGTFGMFSAEVAYSTDDENGLSSLGVVGIGNAMNFGGVKTPFYTQMILNQNYIKTDSDTIVARVAADTEYGKFSVAYDMTTYNASTAATNEYTELDVTYSTKIADSTELFAAYVMQTDDARVAPLDDTQSTVRVWARYNF